MRRRGPRARPPEGCPGPGSTVDVVDVRADRDRQVARQRPRGRGPDEGELAGLQPQADRQRGVLARLVDVVVHAQLVVGQRRLVAPAVRQHAVALVRQVLVVEALERPDDRLHERDVERLVVVVEVDPAGLARHVLAPLARVPQHRLAARLVERGEPHLLDLRRVRDAEQPLRLELGGQPVRVPAEPALDAVAAHRLVARHDVLGVPGQQVAVVRQAVGERAGRRRRRTRCCRSRRPRARRSTPGTCRRRPSRRGRPSRGRAGPATRGRTTAGRCSG